MFCSSKQELDQTSVSGLKTTLVPGLTFLAAPGGNFRPSFALAAQQHLCCSSALALFFFRPTKPRFPRKALLLILRPLSNAVHETCSMLRSFEHINRPSDRVTPKAMSSLRTHSPAPRPPTSLPNEIFAQIAQYILGDAFSDLDVTQPTLGITKPPFVCIDGMTRASRRLRAIALPEWFRLFIVGRADDWIWASRLSGMHTWVR